ncbi:hypothetical protein D9758_011876 [Tetrapyrgos nigripes]|uniref:HAT C-terminal dimerisation domain-containing protein n=1 Tax=Tetrapyrgos nigripes TaxID=182062 RepID=A0A8H5FR86_9AGAR|nr:hypothetical protein D9758_011876 [Tetrapyrgos nigripes]
MAPHPEPPVPQHLQTTDKKRKTNPTVKATGNDPIDSTLPSKKPRTATINTPNTSSSTAPKKAKSTPKTAIKAATNKIKQALWKSKARTTVSEDEESNDSGSDNEPQPEAAPAKNSKAANVITIEDDSDNDDDADTDNDKTSTTEDEHMQEESNEAELHDKTERLMKGWNSEVYAFFEPVPTIEYINGRKCQDTTDAKGTKTLHNHINKCKAWGPAALTGVQGLKVGDARKAAAGYLRDGTISAVFKRGKKGIVTYSHHQHTSWETRAEIVRWVAESGRQFAIVKDRGFQCLMKTGRPGYYLPHPMTVARDVKMVFAKTCRRIASMLQVCIPELLVWIVNLKEKKEYEGDINFATDTWSSPNHRAYIAVTVHLEHDGEPLSFLLDFVEVATSHSGEKLAEVFAGILMEFGIEDKIFSITADNASSNDTMISALETLLPDFPGEPNRTRCFNHIINLVGKSLTKLFDVTSSKKVEDMDDVEKALMDLATGVDMEDLQARLREVEEGGEQEKDSQELIVDMMEGLSEEEKEELRKQIIPVQQVLVKFQKTSFKIINSTTILLPQWRSILEERKQPQTVIPRDVSTCWNSTCDLLGYCIDKEHKKAYRAITGNEEDNGLQQYALSKKEWAIAEQLYEVLDVLRDATLLFSSCNTPNLATVLPVLDDIDRRFTEMGLSSKFDPAIHAAVSLAKKTLNKYYGKFDYSEVYRVAMILHPRHKLNYFNTADWPDSWVATAKEMVQEVYDRDYKHTSGEEPMDVDKPASPVASKKHNRFDDLPALKPPKAGELGDELDRYLSADVEAMDDVLGWWYGGKKDFPTLYRMGLDYLTIPRESKKN